jgi:hypothetical protein
MLPPPDSELNQLSELKRLEEQKREAHWHPTVCWRVIRELIAWADAQPTVGRNTPERCLELQRKKKTWGQNAFGQ